MTLFFQHSGPLLRYVDGILYIEDLNPELKTKWRMSRLEMIQVGLKFILAGARR